MSANNDPSGQPVDRDRMTVTYLQEDRPAPGPLSLIACLVITICVSMALMVIQSGQKAPVQTQTTKVAR